MFLLFRICPLLIISLWLIVWYHFLFHFFKGVLKSVGIIKLWADGKYYILRHAFEIREIGISELVRIMQCISRSELRITILRNCEIVNAYFLWRNLIGQLPFGPIFQSSFSIEVGLRVKFGESSLSIGCLCLSGK